MKLVYQEENHAVGTHTDGWYYCIFKQDDMWHSHFLDHGSPACFQRLENAISYVQNIVIAKHAQAIPAERNYKPLEEKHPRSYGTAYWAKQYKTAAFNAWGFGYDYMRGIISIEDIRTFLFTEGLRWPYQGFSNNVKQIRKGVIDAIAQNVAIPSRMQPEQPDAEQIALWKKEKRGKRT